MNTCRPIFDFICVLRQDAMNKGTVMRKLYEEESYRQEITTVISDYCKQDERLLIQLEETIFMPNEGGQYADTGIIECQNKEIEVLGSAVLNGRTWLEISDSVDIGSSCKARIDWDKRFMRMQQHTGEHILSGLIHSRYGYDNIAFHLSDDDLVTLAFNGGIDWEEALQLEKAANDVIYKNLPVTDSYPSPEELAKIPYRSKKEIDGQVRLITIGNEMDLIDICACCAPHVSSTGAVGIIKILSLTPYKGGTQLGFLAGGRALEYLSKEHDMIDSVARTFSTSIDRIPFMIDNMRHDLEAVNIELTEVWNRYIDSEIDKLKGENHGFVFVDKSCPQSSMKNAYNLLVEAVPGYTGIFAGNDDEGYRYYAGSANKDSRILGEKLKSVLGARGGGSAQMVQGSVKADAESIRKILSDE